MKYGTDALNEDQVGVFLSTAIERHKIYLRKELGMPKPWTGMDPFKDWFFCNLFRRLDKTSKVIYDKVITPNEDHPFLWAAILITRWFSYIPTIEMLVENNCLFSVDGWKEGIKLVGEVRGKGETFTTSGFMLNQNIQGHKGLAKNVVPFLIAKKLAEACFEAYEPGEAPLGVKVEQMDYRLQRNNTLENRFNLFIKAPATAGFMAYEYVTDLSYSTRYKGPEATDFYTWCSCTVGSLRGLKRLCALDYNKPANVDVYELTNYLRNLLEIRGEKEYAELEPELKQHPDAKAFLTISMREIEHWLCEYDKYSRIANKEKRMKRKYNGRN